MISTGSAGNLPECETVVISDVHLGKNDVARADLLLEYLQHLVKIGCKRLILNGDFIDGWKLKKGDRLSELALRVLSLSNSPTLYPIRMAKTGNILSCTETSLTVLILKANGARRSRNSPIHGMIILSILTAQPARLASFLTTTLWRLSPKAGLKANLTFRNLSRRRS
jgi:hypothetical protein